MNGVYRPLNNALLERQLFQTRLRATRAAAHESLRATVGEQLIPKIGNQQRNIREILRVLQRREMLVMLVDQRASQGVEAKLFGLPAMTTHLPAQLAITGGHILLPLSMFRKDGVEFVFRFHEPIAVPEPPADDAAVLALTQKINDFLEASIREHPEQWLWLHDRWRPKKRD